MAQDSEGFVECGVNVSVEAEQFFGGRTRNTVLFSLSNALDLPIIALSSSVNHPPDKYYAKVDENSISSACGIQSVWSGSL